MKGEKFTIEVLKRECEYILENEAGKISLAEGLLAICNEIINLKLELDETDEILETHLEEHD
jgi:hypothetical protein